MQVPNAAEPKVLNDAQEELTQQEIAVQVPNAAEPKVLNDVEPGAPSVTESRAPVVPEPVEPLRKSKRPRAEPSYLKDFYT